MQGVVTPTLAAGRLAPASLGRDLLV